MKDMLINICEVFMPDTTPEYIHGEEAEDQLIENSSHFSITSFKEALLQIK